MYFRINSYLHDPSKLRITRYRSSLEIIRNTNGTGSGRMDQNRDQWRILNTGKSETPGTIARDK
jgi:hypothetical protein